MKRKDKAEETKPSSAAPEAGAGRQDDVAAGYNTDNGAGLSFPETNPELCRDIMTKNPVCCSSSDTVHQAAQIMRDQDIGSVAIVKDEQSRKLVGILTDRDLAVRVLADGHDPRTARAGDVMTPDPVTCSPEDSITTCLEGMQSRQVRRMPVVDDAGRVVGIIAQADVAIRLHEPNQTAEVVEEISRPSSLR